MRMWMVDPKIMCRKHLLGEHVELHMFVGSLRKGKNVTGYIMNNLLEISSLINRHKVIVEEMKCRGYSHKSELTSLRVYDFPPSWLRAKINKENSLKDLMNRCPECFRNHQFLKSEQYKEMKQLANKHEITIVGCNYKTRRVKNEI